MQDQSIQRKNNKAKRANNSRVPIQKTFGENATAGFQGNEGVDAGYLIQLPEVRFNPELVPSHRLAEIAKIFYSASYGKEKRSGEDHSPEPLSSILPRVMVEIVRLRQQKTN